MANAKKTAEAKLDETHDRFIEATSRIAAFWGLPRALGAIYGAIYLSPHPISLDDLVKRVGVTKGAVSTHVRALDRLQLVEKEMRLGDRRDYYVARSDLWGVVKNLLRQRQNSTFDAALGAVRETLAQLRDTSVPRSEASRHAFYLQRIEAMQSFFDSLDSMVAAVLALDDLRASTVRRLFGKGRKRT